MLGFKADGEWRRVTLGDLDCRGGVNKFVVDDVDADGILGILLLIFGVLKVSLKTYIIIKFVP